MLKAYSHNSNEGDYMNELPNLMSVKELMAYLKCSRTTAYKLCRKKKFPSLRIGNNFYVNKDKLAEWIDNECRQNKY